MKIKHQFTGLIEREGDGYVALCPEFDVASQGDTVDEARRNLHEAVELFLDTASPAEVEGRLQSIIGCNSYFQRSPSDPLSCVLAGEG